MATQGIDAACRSEQSDPSCPFRCFSAATKPSYLHSEPWTDDQRENIDHMIDAAVNGLETLTSYPLEMELRLDTHCDLDCEVCSQRPFRGSRFELRIEDFEDELRDFIHHGLRLTLTGGEPTVSPRYEHLMRIVRQAAGARVFLITNGLHLMERVHPHADLIDVAAVSLDAATAETYRRVRGGDWGSLMDQIVRFRDDARSAHVTLTASFVISDVNLEEMPAMVELVGALGVKHMSFNEVHSIEHWMDPERAAVWTRHRDDPGRLEQMRQSFDQAMYEAGGLGLDISYSLPSLGRLGRSQPR